MFDEAITDALTLPPTSSQTEIRSRTAWGDSGFVGGRLRRPNDRDVAARLRQDGALIAGVGLR